MRLMKSVLIALAAVLGVSCLVSTSFVLAQNKKAVRIGGAGLLSDIVQSYTNEFGQRVSNCPIVVIGATTGQGFQMLLDGDLEIAMVTRKITPEETKKAEAKGLSLKSRHLGQIGLAIITNSKNPVSELTMDQLAKIFKGEITNWNKVGGPNEPIKVTARAVPETGAGVLVQEVLLKGAPYAKDAAIMSSYNTTVSVCSKAYAIGYIPTTTTYFSQIGERGVKIIQVKKDVNSPPYQLSGGLLAKDSEYPVSVGFLMYWNASADDQCTKGFVDFVGKQTQ